MEEKDQLRLYSISGAARALSLGKDAVYRLVADGKLGYIQIGKRKKIPHRELVRFQNEQVTREKQRKSQLPQLDFTAKILKPINNPPSFDAKIFIKNKVKELAWQSSESETT